MGGDGGDEFRRLDGDMTQAEAIAAQAVLSDAIIANEAVEEGLRADRVVLLDALLADETLAAEVTGAMQVIDDQLAVFQADKDAYLALDEISLRQ